MNEQDMLNAVLQFMWATANDQQRAALHALAAGELYNDYCTLQNILLGYNSATSIDNVVIDHAEEYYKQLNKALLICRDLSPVEKQVEESEIDNEAKNLRSKWVKALFDRRIQITYKWSI